MQLRWKGNDELKQVKCELYHDHFENHKRYPIRYIKEITLHEKNIVSLALTWFDEVVVVEE